MLYTRKGDSGTTKMFNTKSAKRISKSSCQTESLGVLDELNSFLGLVKVKSIGISWTIDDNRVVDIIAWIQNCLFTVQAEVAGAKKKITTNKIKDMELVIGKIEKELSPIKTFFLSGGTELSTLFDISRTLARKAERRVVEAFEEGDINVCKLTLAFLNRLSSLLYALARLSNLKAGAREESPRYN